MSARNFYIMQSAVAPMQSEMPCYTPLTNHRTEVHTVPMVMATDYAALEAECERLRVKLMTIASAEPARHGIEWAKAHAAEGNNEVYAKWREAIDEAHALAAENARLRAELEQSRDLIVEMSKHCNATALVADWLERNT